MIQNEPIISAALVRSVILIVASLIGTQFTEGEMDAIITGIMGVIAVVSMMLTREKVTPVGKAARNVSDSVLHTTGNADAARAASASVVQGQVVQ